MDFGHKYTRSMDCGIVGVIVGGGGGSGGG